MRIDEGEIAPLQLIEHGAHHVRIVERGAPETAHDRLDRTARLIRAKTDRPGARWTTIEAWDERF